MGESLFTSCESPAIAFLSRLSKGRRTLEGRLYAQQGLLTAAHVLALQATHPQRRLGLAHLLIRKLVVPPLPRRHVLALELLQGQLGLEFSCAFSLYDDVLPLGGIFLLLRLVLLLLLHALLVLEVELQLLFLPSAQ